MSRDTRWFQCNHHVNGIEITPPTDPLFRLLDAQRRHQARRREASIQALPPMGWLCIRLATRRDRRREYIAPAPVGSVEQRA